MSSTRKKRTSYTAEERRQAHARKVAQLEARQTLIDDRISRMKAVCGEGSIITGGFANVPIDISFITDKGATVFSRNEAYRIRKNDIIQLTCDAVCKPGDMCIVIHKGQYVFAIARDREQFFTNMNSTSRDEDIIEIAEDDYIGSIACILPAIQAPRATE